MTTSWISLPPSVPASLAHEVEASVQALLKGEKVSAGEVDYIHKYGLTLLERTTLLSDKRLERVRALCSLWEVQFRATSITSHRKYIGPIIVAVKRLLFPFLRIALADLVRQQRAFNAEAVALLAELASEQQTKENNNVP